MQDRSHQTAHLTAQVAQFLNIETDRVTIDEYDRAIIHCASDAEMYELQNHWRSLTDRFHERIKYVVLHKDDYQRALPLNLKIWMDQSLVKPM